MDKFTFDCATEVSKSVAKVVRLPSLHMHKPFLYQPKETNFVKRHKIQQIKTLIGISAVHDPFHTITCIAPSNSNIFKVHFD